MPKNPRGRDKFKKQQKKLARKSERAEKQRTRGLVVFSIVILIIFAAWATIKSVGAGDDTRTTAEGWTLPKLTGKGTVSIDSYAGKPVVVTFFSHTCTTCNDDMNSKLAVNQVLGNKVTFIGVASQEPTKPSGKVFAEQSGLIKWPLAWDRGGANNDDLFRVTGGTTLPYTVIYDKNGRKVWASSTSQTPQALAAQLQKLFHIPVPTGQSGSTTTTTQK